MKIIRDPWPNEPVLDGGEPYWNAPARRWFAMRASVPVALDPQPAAPAWATRSGVERSPPASRIDC